MSNDPWVQEKKQKKKKKKDFQDGRHGNHLRFPIGRISAIFDLQVTPMLPIKFQVNWSFGSGKEAKNKFQDGCHGGMAAILDFRSTSYF